MQLMTRDEITEMTCDEILFLGSSDGEFDKAIIGTVTRAGTSNPVLVYSVETVLKCLTEQGMDQEDALEWFSYNIDGAYLGEYTPVYMHAIDIMKPSPIPE